MSVLVRKIFPFLKNCLFKKNLTHPQVIYSPTLLRELILSFSEVLNSTEGTGLPWSHSWLCLFPLRWGRTFAPQSST